MTNTQWTRISLIAVVIAALVILLTGFWFTFGPTLASHYLSYDFALIAASGTIGDAFGPLNALFAALGFSAVMLTLIVQGFSISNQQDEQHRLKFESSFFQLLRLLREVRGEISYLTLSKEKNSRLVGSRALKGAYEDAKHYLIKECPLHRPLSRAEVSQLYKRYVHIRSEDGLGPYFRIIYTILRRIDQDKLLTEKEKIEYGNLLRGQLGSPEVALIMLNGLIKDSNDLEKYLVRFRIPRYLPSGPVRNAVVEFYSPEAFLARAD